jgi:trk system potassium uptake protein TrkA
MKKVAIIGLGSFGTSLAKTLEKKKIQTIAIDTDQDKVNNVKNISTQPIMMDATKRENLLTVGIREVDLVVVSTGPELEPSIIIVHLLKELGVKDIFAKALTEDHEKILYLIGATEVSFPERDIAIKIGNKLSSNILLDYLPLDSNFVIQEIAAPDKFVGKTLAQINIRQKYNVTVIAIRSLIPEKTHINPGADFVVKESDILIIFGSDNEMEHFHSKLN